MADTWVEKPFLKINEVDYSSSVRSISLTFGRETVEKTAGGDGTRVNMSGLKNWRCEVTLKDDYADNGLDDALYNLADAGTPFILRVRPSTDSSGAANPEYYTASNVDPFTAAAGAIFDGPYTLIGGSIGALAEKTVAFVPAGTATKLHRNPLT